MKPNDFEELSEHLTALDPIIEEFASRHGFEVRRTRLGRYPRRRIVRRGDVHLYIDLQMDLTDDGQFFSVFEPSVPYSMGAGAWFVEGHHRFSQGTWCFQGVPFREVGHILPSELDKALDLISAWDREHLREHGEQTLISAKS